MTTPERAKIDELGLDVEAAYHLLLDSQEAVMAAAAAITGADEPNWHHLDEMAAAIDWMREAGREFEAARAEFYQAGGTDNLLPNYDSSDDEYVQ